MSPGRVGVTKQLAPVGQGPGGTGLLMPWSLHFTPKHTMTNAHRYVGCWRHGGLLIMHFPGDAGLMSYCPDEQTVNSFAKTNQKDDDDFEAYKEESLKMLY